MAIPYGVTKEGLELQFGTNHIGHFLFTNLFLSKKDLSCGIKVVNVSSLGHKRGPVRFYDYNFQVSTFLFSHLPFPPESIANFDCRMENVTTSGKLTVKVKLPICYSQYHWRKNLAIKASSRSVFTQGALRLGLGDT
jgi:NAD(P)-dependent dehydrogenase (short-subunit alcohol dehydrogenase family)